MSDYIPARLKGYYQILRGALGGARTPLPRRGSLLFRGMGVGVEDDPATGQTVVTVAPGGADAAGGTRTTDDQGPLLLASLGVPADSVLRVEVDVEGHDVADMATNYATTTHYTIRRTGSGTVVVEAPDVISSEIKAALSGAIVSVEGLGGNLRVLVTGVVGYTLDWTGRIRVRSGPYVPQESGAGPNGPPGPAGPAGAKGDTGDTGPAGPPAVGALVTGPGETYPVTDDNAYIQVSGGAGNSVVLPAGAGPYAVTLVNLGGGNVTVEHSGRTIMGGAHPSTLASGTWRLEGPDNNGNWTRFVAS